MAEQTIIETIRERYPDHGIIGEESGEQPGNDTIWIVVCDTVSPIPGCDSAYVVITVTPVNDPPVVADDTINIAEDSVVIIDVLPNDNDDADNPLGGIDPGTVDTLTGPQNGSVTIDPITGEILDPHGDPH